MDREYWSHRDHNPHLLRGILNQIWDCCWSIAPTRQLEADIGIEALPDGFGLSIQETIDCMPRENLDHLGRLNELVALEHLLVDVGTVLESENPLTYHLAEEAKVVNNHAGRYMAAAVIRHQYEDLDFETDLMSSLLQTPVAARLIVTNKYDSIVGEDVYDPRSNARELSGHMILITGYGIDSTGKSFWEAQDSYGVNKGAGGYIRIARYKNLLSDFYQIAV